jgi:hypothetical protein
VKGDEEATKRHKNTRKLLSLELGMRWGSCSPVYGGEEGYPLDGFAMVFGVDSPPAVAFPDPLAA